jgi:hypothetical protein
MPDHNELIPNLKKLEEHIKKYFSDEKNINAIAKLDTEAMKKSASTFQGQIYANAGFVKNYLDTSSDAELKEVYAYKLSSSAISELEQAITKYKMLNPSAKDLCDAILSQLSNLSTSIKEAQSKPKPK